MGRWSVGALHHMSLISTARILLCVCGLAPIDEAGNVGEMPWTALLRSGFC